MKRLGRARRAARPGFGVEERPPEALARVGHPSFVCAFQLCRPAWLLDHFAGKKSCDASLRSGFADGARLFAISAVQNGETRAC